MKDKNVKQSLIKVRVILGGGRINEVGKGG
jgi:hypothetical protein